MLTNCIRYDILTMSKGKGKSQTPGRGKKMTTTMKQKIEEAKKMVAHFVKTDRKGYYFYKGMLTPTSICGGLGRARLLPRGKL